MRRSRFPFAAGTNDVELTLHNSGGDPSGSGTQILGGLSQISQIGRALEVSHRDILPVIDIYASNEGRDLGAVSEAIKDVLTRTKGDVPRGAIVQMQGQGVTMKSAYSQLLIGLAFSIVLVYLVIWTAHGLIYRWPRTRITDATVEAAIERIAMPGYLALCSLFGKNKKL